MIGKGTLSGLPEDFRKASMENAKGSIQEAGVARFDVLQEQEEPSRFLLVEEYYTPKDQLKHRETAHFKKWKSETAEMLAEPYTFKKYNNISPEDRGWNP